MNKELAVKMAMHEGEGKSLYEQCKLANEIFKANGGTAGESPFAPSTLAQIGFTEYLKNECTQRELDLVTIQTLLEQCHRVLHISWGVLRQVTPQDIRDLKMLYPALVRLNLTHFLLDTMDEQEVINLIKE